MATKVKFENDDDERWPEGIDLHQRWSMWWGSICTGTRMRREERERRSCDCIAAKWKEISVGSRGWGHSWVGNGVRIAKTREGYV